MECGVTPSIPPYHTTASSPSKIWMGKGLSLWLEVVVRHQIRLHTSVAESLSLLS